MSATQYFLKKIMQGSPASLKVLKFSTFKFHYAIWSQTGSKQVRGWSQTCSEL